MASRIPKEVKKEIVDDWIAEPTWKVALFKSTSNCNTDGTSTYAQCQADGNQCTGTGYTAGGATLVGRAGAYINVTNRRLAATNATWTSATITGIRYAVVYETAGGLIRFVYDLASDYSVTNGTFTITWNTDGLAKVK